MEMVIQHNKNQGWRLRIFENAFKFTLARFTLPSNDLDKAIILYLYELSGNFRGN